MSTDRIVPKTGTGYDFKEKDQYRRQLWKEVAHHFKPFISSRRALLMPSAEGLEIEVARSVGFQTKNLWIVDENPAIVAVLKRRYPEINTIGIKVERIGERIDQRFFDFANLDLCGHAVSNIPVIKAFVGSRCMKAVSLIAITMQKGRESSRDVAEILHWFDEEGNDKNPFILPAMKDFYAERLKEYPGLSACLDVARVDIVRFSLNPNLSYVIRTHQYFSSIPMMWMLSVVCDEQDSMTMRKNETDRQIGLRLMKLGVSKIKERAQI